MTEKTTKKIDHFKPLWQKNVPKFGIAHAMALGLGPWLAVEVPDLVAKGLIKPVKVLSSVVLCNKDASDLKPK